jgi:hypothetical protein
MMATGELYLSRTTPVAQVAADGKFVLTLLAFDRQGGHHVYPWRLVWTGRDAQTFWDVHRAHLQPGTPLRVELSQLRLVDGSGRNTGAETLACVNSLYLPVIAANPHQKHQAKTASSPRAACVDHY